MKAQPRRPSAEISRRAHTDALVAWLNQDGSSESTWSNLGDWSAADEYQQAAGALAMRVGEAARITSESNVLDLGCGYGDSLRCWTRHFNAASVVGIEADPSRARFAASHFDVVCGSANSAAAELSDESFDAVISVDAAYHFRTLVDVVGAARRLLSPGGSISFTTIAVASASPARKRLAQRALANISDIPLQNLLTVEELRRCMLESGFGDVIIADLSADVFGGFANNIASRRGTLHRIAGSRMRSRLLGTAFMCRHAAGLGVEYVLISATAMG